MCTKFSIMWNKREYSKNISGVPMRIARAYATICSTRTDDSEGNFLRMTKKKTKLTKKP